MWMPFLMLGTIELYRRIHNHALGAYAIPIHVRLSSCALEWCT